MDEPQILRRVFDAAVAASLPAAVVPPALPPRPSGRIVVLGAGKASAAMAAAVEAAWGAPLEGLVVTRYGHGAPTRFIEVVEAGHPLPDAAGADAARRALALAGELTADDTALVLLSGGGSALWSAPLPPIALAEKQELTRALVLSGASIAEINCVRKHLSAIKGGRLAVAAHPASVLALAISDVPGDDLSVIASGPTVADPTTQNDAKRILARYGLATPWSVAAALNTPANESIKPGDPRLSATRTMVVARPADALAAAADAAHRLGCATQVLGVRVEGRARDVAQSHAEIAEALADPAQPVALLSGGELTVTVTGKGRGGPNREYLLALALALNGRSNVWALACDSDGIDGSDQVAGAWIGPDTLARARTLGLEPETFLRNNDAGTFFARLGDEIVTGPTRTNVSDIRAILVTPRR